MKNALILLVVLLGTAAAVAGYKATATAEIGFRGVGMQITDSDKALGEKLEANKVPPALPPPNEEGALLAVDAYENVQVLGHLSTARFTRLMTAITTWVSPEQGCAYCHNTENMASDEVYAKNVTRHMFRQTWYLNENWQSHVKQTGVTCYTCHRGQPVPEYVWFEGEEADASGMLGYRGPQNMAAADVGLASLPSDVFETYLYDDTGIRVQSDVPLPSGNRSSIKQTEWTYGLMIHFSNSLGVNCTFCHNSRSWASWEQSPVQRGTAWYGIRMVRRLNNDHLQRISDLLPDYRLGPSGDVPKANCNTCHQGAYKPFLGHSMLDDYPSLRQAEEQPPKYTITIRDDRVDIPAKIQFDTDSHDILPESYRLLNAVKRAVAEDDDIAVIRIVGHTDLTGIPEENQALSEKRAASVKRFLVDRGMEIELEAVGMGQSQPLCASLTPTCNERNRRVEFVISRRHSDPPPVEGEEGAEGTDGETAAGDAPGAETTAAGAGDPAAGSGADAE